MPDKTMRWINQTQLRRYTFAIAGALLGAFLFYHMQGLETRTEKRIEEIAIEELQEAVEVSQVVVTDAKLRLEAQINNLPPSKTCELELDEYTPPQSQKQKMPTEDLTPQGSLAERILFTYKTLLNMGDCETQRVYYTKGTQTWNYPTSEGAILSNREFWRKQALEKFKLEDMTQR